MTMSEVIKEIVELGDRSYTVAVGHNVVQEAVAMIPSSAKRIAIVTQHGIPTSYIPQFDGVTVSTHYIGVGESHKSLTTIEQLCREFAQAGITRGDVVVAVGVEVYVGVLVGVSVGVGVLVDVSVGVAPGVAAGVPLAV